MKNSTKIYLFLALAAFSNIFAECSPEPMDPPADDLVGKWETTYFEHNGNDVTQQYQMTLHFDDQGQCVQTLIKPGGVLSSTLQYAKDPDGNVVTVGTAHLSIDKNDGTNIRLRYLNGAQPDGFIAPWTADFLRIE
ncbi:MAG: hypothetical protein ACKVT2_17350 [Saprospiraceae bacterium]